MTATTVGSRFQPGQRPNSIAPCGGNPPLPASQAVPALQGRGIRGNARTQVSPPAVARTAKCDTLRGLFAHQLAFERDWGVGWGVEFFGVSAAPPDG